MIITSY